MVSTSLHHGMFEPMIRILGSDEQVKTYLGDVMSYKILGCYAQTEVAHGSDVQRLQTEAVLDEINDTFIINTPDIKAAKFWPGELGKMATHAVFHAKLIIKGEAYGVHAFI
jgi:acyl-CoA oxidase